MRRAGTGRDHRFGGGRGQRDDVGQSLQQQFQLLRGERFVAPAAEVMPDIMLQLLPESLVLLLQPGVLRFQRGDAATQFFELLE